MSVSGVLIKKEYIGNGSLTAFTIPFSFQDASQIVVTLGDLAMPQGVSAKSQGVHYTVVGSSVNFVVPPPAGFTVTIYRLTPRTQNYDFVNSQPTLNEDIETALDRVVMMLQEIEGLQSPSTIITSGGLAIGASQTLPAGGTVTVVATSPRQVCPVQGPVGGGTLSLTTAVATGSVEGQEVVLEGISDNNPVHIVDGGNLILNGDCTLQDGDTLSLYWSLTRLKWVEYGRSV